MHILIATPLHLNAKFLQLVHWLLQELDNITYILISIHFLIFVSYFVAFSCFNCITAHFNGNGKICTSERPWDTGQRTKRAVSTWILSRPRPLRFYVSVICVWSVKQPSSPTVPQKRSNSILLQRQFRVAVSILFFWFRHAFMYVHTIR